MPIRDAIKTFNANAESVYGLIDFDRAVLELATSGLEELSENLAGQGSNNAARLVTNRVTSFKNVRSNDSLRPRYETIYNQCVVLLVSYFGAAVHTVFSRAIGNAYASAQAFPAADLEIKVRWRDLPRDGQPLGEVSQTSSLLSATSRSKTCRASRGPSASSSESSSTETH